LSQMEQLKRRTAAGRGLLRGGMIEECVVLSERVIEVYGEFIVRFNNTVAQGAKFCKL
jgi:hypothetical protein